METLSSRSLLYSETKYTRWRAWFLPKEFPSRQGCSANKKGVRNHQKK